MADGNALHVTRTKAFSAVEIQKTLERRLFSIFFPVFLQNTGQASAWGFERLKDGKAGF
jgi:hypothetical protein